MTELCSNRVSEFIARLDQCAFDDEPLSRGMTQKEIRQLAEAMRRALLGERH